MQEEQKEIQKQHRQSQEKFVYYIIALSVSSIGFAVYRTSGQKLHIYQIPLGLSLMCWTLSVSYGLSYLKYFIKTLYDNNAWFDVRDGKHDLTGTNPSHIKIGLDTLKGIIIKDTEKSASYFIYMNNLFYAGIVFFIIWHFLEMYKATIPY